MALRVVITPDSFKGTADASAVCAALAEGWLSAQLDDEVVSVPMAEGGEGTLDALAAASPGSTCHSCWVLGPDSGPVDAR